MLAGDLAIDEVDALGLQPLDQGREGDLGGVGLVVEHRLAAEAAADADAVDPAHQPAVPPGLHAVGVAELVEADVGSLHLRGDPGPVLVVPRDLGAGPDDLGEGGVVAGLEAALADGPRAAAA